MSARNRTPLILGAIAAVLLVAVIVSFVVLMARGSGSAPALPEPRSSTSAPEQTASIPTPEATVEVQRRIEVAGDGFTVTGTGDTPFTHAWGDEAAPAIAALTALFGDAPEEGFQAGDAHFYAYDLYEWDGFTLADVRLGEGNKPRDQVPDPTWVSFTANTIGEVEVSADIDVRVGMSASEVAALGPDETGATRAVFGLDQQSFYQDGDRRFPLIVDLEDGAATRLTVRYDPPGA